MANVEEVIVKFRAEGGKEVEASFHSIAEASKAVSEHVGKVGSSLEGLRLKSEGRVAHNIGEIAASFKAGASAGDLLAQGIGRVTESFRGSLLFAGAAAIGSSLYDEIVKVGEAAIQLETHIQDITQNRGPARFQALDQIKQNLADVNAQIDSLNQRTREEGGFGGGVIRDIRRGLTSIGGGGTIEQQVFAERGQRERLRQQRRQDIDDLTSKTKDLADVQRTINEQGDYDAKLLQEKIRHEQALGEAARIGRTDQLQGSQLAHAENELNKQNLDAFRNQEEIRGKALQHQSDLAELSKSGLTSEQSLIQALNLELSYRQKVLDIAKNTEQAQSAGVQLAQAQSQAQAQITAQIRSRGADVGTGSVTFQNQSIARQIEEANARAEARAERGQLRFESRGRQLTPEEQARLSATGNIIGNEESERLEEERRGLIRQQAQAQQILENNRGVPNFGGGLGRQGDIDFRNRAQRLAEIDTRLNQISTSRIGPRKPGEQTGVDKTNAILSSMAEDIAGIWDAVNIFSGQIGVR